MESLNNKFNFEQEFEHLFRHAYGRIVSALSSKYSPTLIDQIEDSVQESLLKAMQIWGYKGQPKDPSAWLYRVANNHLIDQLRRAKKTFNSDDFEQTAGSYEYQSHDIENDIQDDQLRMIFACCHPSLEITEQIMLSLKILGGLSVKEIAHAFMKKEAAIKKSITRAKQKFKVKIKKLDVPVGRELRNRLDVVLKVIYLMFNEGYKATSGENLIKKDICEEAIRLACLLKQNSNCETDDLNSLLALMCFNVARFDARMSSGGELLTLELQDRNLWNKAYIQWGMKYMTHAEKIDQISQYHLEAGIACLYIVPKNFQDTNWKSILDLYDLLVNINPSPIVALNRVVVLAKVKGVDAALDEISSLESNDLILNNHLYYSIKGELELEIGNKTKAADLLNQAKKLASNKIEVAFIQKKLETIES